MSFGEHLEELRKRLVLALLVPIPIFIVALVFGGPLLAFLIEPAEAALRDAGLPAKLLATSPAEPFIAYLKVGAIAAVSLSAPWIFYQAWLFIAPGLYQHERRFAHLLFPLSGVLTIAALSFLYTVLLPVTLRFFIAFGSAIAASDIATAPLPDGVDLPSVPTLSADPPAPQPGQMWLNETTKELRLALAPRNADTPPAIMAIPLNAGDSAIAPQYRVSEYVSLCFNLGIVFTIAFQLPVVMLLGGWTGLLEPKMLGRWRRHVLFACAVAAAVATPADPMSMLLLMFPLYALFELGLILMRFTTPPVATDGDQGE